MNNQQVCDIAETAFKARFGDIISVKPDFDHYDDPLVDMKIICEGNIKQMIAPDKVPEMMEVRSEIIDKVWRDAQDSLGYPCVHFIAKSDIGRRNPATA